MIEPKYIFFLGKTKMKFSIELIKYEWCWLSDAGFVSVVTDVDFVKKKKVTDVDLVPTNDQVPLCLS